MPNLKSLAEEYITDSQQLIKNQAKTQANRDKAYPENRGVWVDVVDGAGAQKTVDGVTYTDKITGKYRAASYTFDSLWQTELNLFMSGQKGNYGSFWQADKSGKWVNVKEALTAYKSTMQGLLDEGRDFIG